MREQSRLSRRSSATLTRALLAVVLLSMIVLLGGQLWLSYRDQVRTAEISAHNLASIFEARLDASLRRIDADLITLAGDIPETALHP